MKGVQCYELFGGILRGHFKKKSVCFGLLYFYFGNQLKQYIRNNTNAKHVNDYSIFNVVMNFFFPLFLMCWKFIILLIKKYKKL